MGTARSGRIGVKQSIPKHLRFPFEDFNRRFPDDDACLEQIKEQRWPDGMAHCEKCGEAARHHRIAGRTAYSCQNCGTQVYPLAGTIFEKSTTSRRIWFYAMYLMSSTRGGISQSRFNAKLLSLIKPRGACSSDSHCDVEDLQLEGPTVEIDETYHGGVRKGGAGRPARGDEKKSAIVGVVERKGRVVAKTVKTVGSATLLGVVREHVLPKSTTQNKSRVGRVVCPPFRHF